MEKMYINGQFTQGNANETIPIINPATEETLSEVPRGTPADVESAIRAAREAFPGWARTPGAERANLLHETANKIRAHEEHLIRLLTMEEGKPYIENEEELLWTHNTFDFYA